MVWRPIDVQDLARALAQRGIRNLLCKPLGEGRVRGGQLVLRRGPLVLQGPECRPHVRPLVVYRGRKSRGTHLGLHERRSHLQMLHVLVGEEAFWAAVRKYVADNAHSLVETDDLRAAFEAVTGQHLGWFFDQWTHLPGSPTVSVSHRWTDEHLRIDVKQEGDRVFAFPLDVEIGTDRGPVTNEWMTEKTLRFTVPLEDAPLYVAVDPQAGVLAQFKNQQPTENWIAQLESPSPAARFAAMDALGEKPSTDAIAKALRGILEHQEEERPYREKAARVLGKLDHTIGDKALVAPSQPPNPLASLHHRERLGSRPCSPVEPESCAKSPPPTPDTRCVGLRSKAWRTRSKQCTRIARGILETGLSQPWSSQERCSNPEKPRTLVGS